MNLNLNGLSNTVMSSLEDFYQELDARMSLPDNEDCHEFLRKAKYNIFNLILALSLMITKQNRSAQYDERWHHVHVYASPNVDQNFLSLILLSIQDIEAGVSRIERGAPIDIFTERGKAQDKLSPGGSREETQESDDLVRPRSYH